VDHGLHIPRIPLFLLLHGLFCFLAFERTLTTGPCYNFANNAHLLLQKKLFHHLAVLTLSSYCTGGGSLDTQPAVFFPRPKLLVTMPRTLFVNASLAWAIVDTKELRLDSVAVATVAAKSAIPVNFLALDLL